MAKNHKLRLRRKILFTILIVSSVGIVGFLTWLGIGLATENTDFELITQYQLPQFKSLEELPDLSSEKAIAIDGEVVKWRETEERLPTASTAKMILGLAIIKEKPFELGETGETMTISEDDYNRYRQYVMMNGSNTPVTVGEEISEYDALAATLMVSSNNMADSLAVWAFGSLDNYRNYAQQMLSEWGINNTHIGEDASGFSESTTSTAADLARIGQKVLENPILAEIVGKNNQQIPVAGLIKNTNRLLGEAGIIGIKTGYIGDLSGYCLVAGYRTGDHLVTTAILKAKTREASFNESLDLIKKMQELVPLEKLLSKDQLVGYYDSWWTGPVAIYATEDLEGLGWAEAKREVSLEMDGAEGKIVIQIGEQEYRVNVRAEEYAKEPTFGERLAHLFGWGKDGEIPEETIKDEAKTNEESINTETKEVKEVTETAKTNVFTNAPSDNCTIKFGALMLINPNFRVENEFIAARRNEMISLEGAYGIAEHNTYNGDNLLDAEAAEHFNQMVKAYEAYNPGHTLETMSCFRAVGTNCGRLCAATGTSDHHTGLTCDLIDPTYGTSLDTDTYHQHPDWQWLKSNSYKYGFIDRFPEAWAGGSMDEPLNVDANGTTGLFETWHYRYVGVDAATEIATGKYNNGQYDSLEHYLLARGMVKDLKNARCE